MCFVKTRLIKMNNYTMTIIYRNVEKTNIRNTIGKPEGREKETHGAVIQCGVVASAPDFERADEGSILTAGLCFKS